MAYKIATKTESGTVLYFNNDYAVFSEKFGTEYKSKEKAKDGLLYARKCASGNAILENLHIEKI